MSFRSWAIHILIAVLFGTLFLLSNIQEDSSFDENYYVNWGNDHVLSLNQGREVRLLLDQYSGAGFISKSYFGSGFFKMKIKLPANDSGGLVTSFYLYLNENGVHDELDFEFLGNRPGKPIVLQTNVFTNGVGGREQRYFLWFDPTTDFHYYSILWNHYQIVFFVDDIPIRVFKKTQGVGYLNNTMQVVVSLWDGSDWATEGGRVKADFNNAPFEAYFQDFNIDGCVSSKINIHCLAQDYWWNLKRYWILNSKQQRDYEHVKKTYMIYDYCKNGLPTNLECH